MCVHVFSHAGVGMTFCSCDHDVDSMTLIQELDLDIFKSFQDVPTYQNEVFGLGQAFMFL